MKLTTRLAGLALVAGGLVGPAAAGELAAKTTAKMGPGALAQRIDQEVQKRLDAEKVKPSAPADDAEFLRRAYLDLTGVIPTAEQAAAFLDSKDPAKRAKLIDELLASPAYGRHMADIWQDMLLPRNSDNRRLQHEPLVKWLEENFNENKPWDKFVADLMTATGEQDKNGAVTFWLANPTADKVNDTVSRLFLGIQLQCAQCHNHPFTKWKQTEYWGQAMFFTKVQPDNVNRAAKNGNTPGVVESSKPAGKKNMLPESAKIVAPKFFGGEEPKVSSSEPYRPVFAQWLTSADNPYFAKAMVNRTWHQLFGRGIVNPVDDMHDGNAPSHPELLRELTQQFVAGGFDLKDLIRAVCNSQAYQRTSKPTADNGDDAALFSHMAIKALSAEQLFDSLAQVVGLQGKGADKGANKNKNQPANSPRQQFINFFRTDEGADPLEYQSGIPQVLRLMNSPQLNKGAALLEQANKAGDSAKAVEVLYLGTLSRRPTAAEAQKLGDYVARHNGKAAYADVLWALVNSSEFALNH